MDAADLISRLHGELVRDISHHEQRHFQGLRAAACHLRRARKVPSNIIKKIITVEEANNLCRQITMISSRSFRAEVIEALLHPATPASSGPKAPTTAVRGDSSSSTSPHSSPSTPGLGFVDSGMVDAPNDQAVDVPRVSPPPFCEQYDWFEAVADVAVQTDASLANSVVSENPFEMIRAASAQCHLHLDVAHLLAVTRLQTLRTELTLYGVHQYEKPQVVEPFCRTVSLSSGWHECFDKVEGEVSQMMAEYPGECRRRLAERRGMAGFRDELLLSIRCRLWPAIQGHVEDCDRNTPLQNQFEVKTLCMAA
eukprot:CAMPEP_0198493726 /NCGR_PEP_ID=MMETSP1462-20131121/4190_1 /TAXON_ID=1333877 /ORGANISM="Brandtodinium nutriculum, Strain RCC3387" /LENGTH=309 /DNA_ID=CAMNT_0044222437 /DNA_START=50 /DNA_END=975 /DNA_ORIENTATION=+